MTVRVARRWGQLGMVAVLALGGAGISQGAAEPGLTISPPVIQVSLPADRPSQTVTVTLTNHTAASQNLQLAVVDFGALDDNGGLFLIGQPNDFERKYGLAAWVRLDHDSVALAPGQAQAVNATILNQPTLSPGGHYAAIVFQAAAGGLSGTAVNLKPEITALIFAIKNGPARYGLDLLSHTASSGGVPASLNLKFRNTGNVHLVPRGLVTVTDPAGREVARGAINENSVMILPGLSRSLSVPLMREGLAWLPGRYLVTIAFRYDGRDDFTTVSFSFVQGGWPALALILAGLVGLVGVGWWLAWRLGRRRQAKGKSLDVH